MPGCAQDHQIKRQAIADYMREKGLEAVVLSARCNFAWATGGGLNHVGTAGETGNASLVLTAGGVMCVTSNIEGPRIAAEELAGLDVEVRTYEWHSAEEAARVWAEVLGPRRAACDVRVGGLPANVVALDGDFASLRWIMSEREIERIRELGQLAGEALEGCCRSVRRGMSEFELAGRLMETLMAKGVRGPTLLVAADERVARYRHPIPTDKRFERYGLGVLGAERDGLMVSCSRMFSFGAVDDELQRLHEAVCAVDAALMEATRPGRTLGEVFAAGQEAYGRAGFADQWRYHHQGGMTGYLPREVKPGPGHTGVVRAGQVYAWNPTIGGSEAFGVKSEDTILVGPEGNEILTVTSDWPTRLHTGESRRWPRPEILEL